MKTKNILISVVLLSSLNLDAQENIKKEELPFIKACLSGQAAILADTAPISLGEKIKHWGIPVTTALIGGYCTYTIPSRPNEAVRTPNEKAIAGLLVTAVYFLYTKFQIMKKHFPSVATQITKACAKFKNNLKNSDFESLQELTSKQNSPSELLAIAKTIDFVSSSHNSPLLDVIAKLKSINPLTDALRENFEILETRLPENANPNPFRDFRQGLTADAKKLTTVYSHIKASPEYEKDYARNRQEKIDEKDYAQSKANISKANAETIKTWKEIFFGKTININRNR